ncbi:MAG: heavy-metal-associated domain-containing protein [Lachnospiraceae bacterium]|nr:heavy-metal-associated domain-containing protein [Lachnospiraceae bacterium]
MEDMVIIGILAVLIIIGIHSSIKHFKGEGGCCGGGSSVKPKKKKLKNIIGKKTVIIEGMSCEHCKNRVEISINEIEGAAAKVNLSKKEAVVSMERYISDEQIRTVIEKAGYTVIEIR